MNKKILLLHFSLLIVGVVMHETQSLDHWIQNFFYLGDNLWIVDNKEFWGKLFLYNLPKILLIVVGVYHIAKVLLKLKKKEELPLFSLQIILSLIIVPGIVGLMKKEGGIPCPYQLKEYGGEFPFISLSQFGAHAGRGCFPAGHASGFFALIAVNPLLGMAAGWITGLYQMMKGNHLFSHTLVAQEISFLLNLFIRAGLCRWKPKQCGKN